MRIARARLSDITPQRAHTSAPPVTPRLSQLRWPFAPPWTTAPRAPACRTLAVDSLRVVDTSVTTRCALVLSKCPTSRGHAQVTDLCQNTDRLTCTIPRYCLVTKGHPMPHTNPACPSCDGRNTRHTPLIAFDAQSLNTWYQCGDCHRVWHVPKVALFRRPRPATEKRPPD